MRSLIAISLALTLSSAWAQDQAPVTSVSYRTKAAPLRVVIADLAKLTHLKLAVGTLRDQPVILSIKDMAVKDLFAHLATVTDSVWEKDGDTYTLTRDKGRERLAEVAEADDRATRLTPAIDKYLKSHANEADWSDKAIADRMAKDRARADEILNQQKGVQPNQNYFVIASSDDQTPGNSVLLEALKKLPVRTLANVKPGQRLVMATTPNAMQKALPYNASNSLAEFVKVYNRLAEASQKASAARPETSNVQTRFNAVNKTTDGVAKLIVVVSRPAASEGISISALLVDRQGNILDSPNTWLEPDAVQAPEAPQGMDGKVKWSEATLALLRAFKPVTTNTNSISMMVKLGRDVSGTLSADPPHSQLDGEMTKLMADPVANEPLSYFVSESLLALADQSGENVIAMVPDSMFGNMAAKLSASEIGLKTLWTQAPQLGIALDKEPSAYLIHPRLFAEADRCRVNRTELARLTQAIAKKDYANLDERSRYSLASPALWDDHNLDASWLRVFSPATYQEFADGGSFHMTYLRLYGTLTPTQRSANANRAMITFNQLSPQQKTLVEQIAYAPTSPMMIGQGTMMISSVGGPGAGPQNSTKPVTANEPTEALPNGLPPMGRIDLDRSWQDGVFSVGPDGHGTFFSTGDMGLRMGFNRSSLPPDLKYETSFEKLLLAEITEINLTLTFSRVPRSETLKDANLKPGATTYTLATLPKAMQDQIDRARQHAMNMKTGSISFGSVGTKPPL